MTNTGIVKYTESFAPNIEDISNATHEEFKKLAKKNGEYHGRRNMPEPVEKNVEPFVSDLRNGYMRLASTLVKRLSPDTQFPKAKLDIDRTKDKVEQLEKDITEKQYQNHQARHELLDFNPKEFKSRLRLVAIIYLAIVLGEILYNTKAFQVIGESMIYAFFISLAVSLCVIAFSHLIPQYIKSIKAKAMRRLAVVGSLILIALVFGALAYLRTSYMNAHGVTVSPVLFVVINFFFFIVALLISFYLLPSWLEMKANGLKLKKHNEILKREQEIKGLNEKQNNLKDDLHEVNKGRLELNHYAQYFLNEVMAMYRESLGIFQSANLMYRSDKKVPDCFSAYMNDLEVEKLRLIFNNPNENKK